VKNQSVEERREIIVKPETKIEKELMNVETTGITEEIIESKGIPLKEAINEVSSSI